LSGSAHGRVLAALRQAITSGELAPNTQLSESALAAQFGTSRTPIREALKQLQTEKLVRIVPRVGTFVTELSWQEIIEISLVKEVLEGLAARLVAQRGDRSALAALERNLDESDLATASNANARYVELVREFHDLIVEHSRNQKLLEHYTTVMNQYPYSRLVFASLQQPARPTKSLSEHYAIFHAIAAGDGDAAEIAMRTHSASARRALAATLLQSAAPDSEPADAASDAASSARGA